jgi:hypothetical protein
VTVAKFAAAAPRADVCVSEETINSYTCVA